MAPTELPPGLQRTALSADDAPDLVDLVVEAGWNQIAADWRFMLNEGGGVGVRDSDNHWVASGLCFPLGAHLSWISMVLTSEPWRRRGIGNALLTHCIALVRDSGRAVGLDATEFGRPVYAKAGFRDLYGIDRWRIAERPLAIEPPAGTAIREIVRGDLPAVASYDVARSAMRRDHVLRHLQGRVPALGFVALQGEMPVGYMLGRDGRTATHLGPVVADNLGVAQALISRAMAALGPPYLMDVPQRQRDIGSWLATAGAHAPRAYTRMLLGDAPGLEDATSIFAIAGPELG